MEKRSVSIPEIIFNLLLMILGLIIMVGSMRLGFGSLKEPGAGLFPFFAGLIIALSIFPVILDSIFKKRSTAEPSSKENTGKILILMATIFVAWILAMPLLGYIFITLIAAFAIAKVMGLEGWIKPLILSMATSLLAYVLFDWFLFLDLPRGLLG
jgi:putative tricarboxylic transport membrane protein